MRVSWRDLPGAAWLQAVAFAALAGLATGSSAPGRYVGENRVDQYVAPGHRLVRTLFQWDPTRGLGRTREDLWPVELVPLTVLRGLGLSPVAAQRVWHALLIAVAAAGAAAVLRAVRGPERGALAPFVAGLVYGFGPYSATFLTPANLYAAFALAPWVVLCALRGPASDRPWRTAAAAALLIGSLGNADYPGVVLSLVAVPLAAWWAARRAGRGLRAALGWLVRAAALTVAVSAAALWKTLASAAVFTQRVTTTESPETVGVASSWSETWRGLGFWLSYFRAPVLARPQTIDLFAEPVVVLATFGPPVLAVVALLLPEVRSRVLWGLALLAGGVLMVGVHPVADPVPFGRALSEAFDVAPLAAGFRTTYKAGAALVLGVAVLAALGTDALARRIGRRGQGRVVFSVGVVLVVGVAGLPFWTGRLYDETRTSGPIPSYWREAARTVDDLPGEGRVLVLPASTRSVYTWGWVGDDILDSLLTRPHAVDTAVPLSGPEAADVLAAVSEATDDARYRDGALAAVLRRLGITHVLLRTDLDPEATQSIPPERMARLRQDPSLRRVRRFGATREDTGSASSAGASTAGLAPVELYEVVDPGPTGPRLAPTDGALVVSGSGAALPPLGSAGDLATSGPVRFSGALEAGELAAALEADGHLVLSDTNRRRVTVVSALVRNESWTLAADEDLDRPAGALFDEPGSQTVAWYRDATLITTDGAPRGGRGSQPWTRPAAAFDGSPSTWWQTVETTGQEGISLRVDLRRPSTIGTVRIDPLPAPGGARRLTEVTLHFSDGTTEVVDVSGGATEVEVDPGPSEWVEVEITGLSPGAARTVGIREVALGDLDLQEWIALPDDVLRKAEDDPALAAAVEAAPLTVLMARDRPEAAFPIEPTLRRRVRLPAAVEAEVRASVVPVDGPAAELVAGLRGECRDDTLRVDGEPVGLTLADEGATVVPGQAVELRGCAPLPLAAGWHEVEVRTGAPLDQVRLDAGAPVAVEAPEQAVTVTAATPDRVAATVDAPEGAVLLTGQSYDRRWVATVDGRDLGEADMYDGQSGWVLPAGRDLDVVMEFRPARRFRVAAWVSLAAVLACAALVLGPRAPRRPRGPRPAGPRGGAPSARP